MLAFSDVGDGPVVVFAHGIGSDHTRWDPIVDRLRDAFRCVSVDLPGHGGSPDEGCSALAAASAIHDLTGALGIQRPTIVGHSLGASVALVHGALFGPRSVVALDPVGLYLPHLADSLAPFVSRLQGEGFADAFLEWEGHLLDELPAPQRAAFADSLAPRAEVVLAYWAGLLRREDAVANQAAFTSLLTSMTVPTLVCLADPPSAEDAAILDGMATTTVEVYPGATHFMHLLDPDRFAARIQAWITAAG